MTDFLLELRSEEIPARMQAKARDDLARLFTAELAKAGLATAETITYATPRRLALIARGLPDATQAVSEETKGPRATAPEQAIEGFLRKTGLTRDQLVDRDGTYFAVIEKLGRATADVLAEAIPAIIRQFPWPKSMRWGAASASTESLRWVRPLHGIVALFGDEVVPAKLAWLQVWERSDGLLTKQIVESEIEAGRITVGHRFHHPGEITIGSAADYVEKLRACHVIVDQDERAAIIRDRAAALAAEAGLALIEDEPLVAENAGLTEWPVPLIGRFDEAFLDVPPEVIQLTARVNQKYFVTLNPPRYGGVASQSDVGGGSPSNATPIDSPLHHASGAVPLPVNGEDLDSVAGSHQSTTLMGALANAFICVANIEASDGGAAIVEGNRKVLAARLADARFFYETDLKIPLEEQAKKLDKIVFHEKLGTVADKVDRVAKLARWLVEEGIFGAGGSNSSDATNHPGERRGPASNGSQLDPGLRRGGKNEHTRLADLAERAARLAKADLVTGMVGEFPELQGVMGGYYARAQGEPREVWEAIRDHYKPVGQGDDVPTAPVTVAVSLADKLDTITQFFQADLKPSGSKDPFALRRSALGVISLILRSELRLSLVKATAIAGPEPLLPAHIALFGREDVLDFFAERLKVQQREAGVRHDLIDAVFALGGEDDLVRLLARVRALQAFVGTEDGANLLAGYKRAANILKKEGYSPLPAGEGQAPKGARGEGERETPATDRPRPSGAAPLPPSPDRRANSLSYTPEKAEADLIAALDAAEPAVARAVDEEDFEAAMAALATLRGPIDAFFDTVTVNDPDPARREARLALLARVRGAVHEVADFSKIEG